MVPDFGCLYSVSVICHPGRRWLPVAGEWLSPRTIGNALGKRGRPIEVLIFIGPHAHCRWVIYLLRFWKEIRWKNTHVRIVYWVCMFREGFLRDERLSAAIGWTLVEGLMEETLECEWFAFLAVGHIRFGVVRINCRNKNGYYVRSSGKSKNVTEIVLEMLI